MSQIFENRCGWCGAFGRELQCHHIVPAREAFVFFDGETQCKDVLIPLCRVCHSAADTEEITRADLFEARQGLGKSSKRHQSTLVERNDIEFNEAMARGHHRFLKDAYVREANQARTDCVKARLLVHAASALRRTSSKKFPLAYKLLDEASSLVPRCSEDLEIEIGYEHAKIFELEGDFRKSYTFFAQIHDRAIDDLARKMAYHSMVWLEHRIECCGGQAPIVATFPECGLECFSTYRMPDHPLIGRKWYAYNLLDSGEYLASVGDAESAIKVLSIAEDVIDLNSFRALRPLLYRNLAIALRKRGDYWLALLASSVALQLHDALGLSEDKGLALLTNLEILKDLGLYQYIQTMKKCSVDMGMNNRWSVARIAQL